MAKFAIYEGNMERLEKKINRIKNKCARYGCEFHYAEVGEEFRELTDKNGNKHIARFVMVEAEGVAVVNGWKFIATIVHTEKGNIINKACEVEVPERYYNSDPVCEHCNSNRRRKDTFLVMNEETGEFKQVGKSCLADFTHGMSAEGVAKYTALFEELIEGETPYDSGCGMSYYPVAEYLAYVAETIKHFGYTRTKDEGRSTKERAVEYYGMEHGRCFPETAEILAEEMASVSFNANSADSIKMVENALAWLAEQDETNDYMHNLKTACSLEYTEYRNLGVIASLFPAYQREVGYQTKRAAQKANEKKSVHVGAVGDRIEVVIDSIKCVTSWETQFGTTMIYKIVDANGNVYTWKTGSYVSEISKIKGTVKGHNEYRGIKQTEMTRCRVS